MPCYSAFPLYTDAHARPGERIFGQVATLPRPDRRPTLVFLVQSGFPRPRTRHPWRVIWNGWPPAGLRLRRSRAPGATSRAFARNPRGWSGASSGASRAGESFGRTGQLDPQALRELAGRERIPRFALRLVCWWSRVMFWDRELKANQAYDKAPRRSLFLCSVDRQSAGDLRAVGPACAVGRGAGGGPIAARHESQARGERDLQNCAAAESRSGAPAGRQILGVLHAPVTKGAQMKAPQVERKPLHLARDRVTLKRCGPADRIRRPARGWPASRGGGGENSRTGCSSRKPAAE